MDDSVSNIIIASLLHDIGKFKQRAFGGDENKCSTISKSIEGLILPSDLSRRHSLWTYDFFENDLIPLTTDKNIKSPNLKWKKIALLASNHHNPSAGDEEIIAEADRLSASQDRIKDDENHYKSGDYLKKHLKPIFRNITLEDDRYKIGHFGYNLNKLEPYNIFPYNINGEITLLTDKYQELWQKFIKDLTNIFKNDNTDLFIDSLLYLLEKYTWCIPSATNDKYNDISLFDHSITTCAIAVALYIYNNSESEDKLEKQFLLFSADLSGIQQFIFQNQKESYKGNSKIIRARLFYIASITHAYYLLLCKKLGIPPFIQLINAGGKFVLLLPNLKSIKNKIEEFKNEIDDWLFKTHYGNFSIICDYSIEAGKNDLGQKKFPEILNEINYKISLAKSRKYESILKKGECVINLANIGNETCKSCGIKELNGKDKEEHKCDFCENLFGSSPKLVGGI